MQFSQKFENFNKILCKQHKRNIIGVVIDINVEDQLLCLHCALEQKSQRIVDKDDFIKLIEQKITDLTTIQKQWIQLSKQFESFLQNQILKLTADFKDQYELQNLIDAYHASDNHNIQTCLEEIQQLVLQFKENKIEQKQQVTNLQQTEDNEQEVIYKKIKISTITNQQQQPRVYIREISLNDNKLQ